MHSKDIKFLCGNTFRKRTTTTITILFLAALIVANLYTASYFQTSRSLLASFAQIFRPTNASNTSQSNFDARQDVGHFEAAVNDPLLRAAKKISAYARTLLVPVINDAYMPFAYNWLCNTKDMGIHKNLLVITVDNKSSEKLQRDWPEVNVVSMNVDSLGGNHTFMEAGYVRVNVKRHQHLYRLLKAGYEVLHFDFDQFWARNPLPYLQGQKGYDLLVTKVTANKAMYCSGFVFIFNSERTIKLWELMVEELEAAEKEIESFNPRRHTRYNDQAMFSGLIKIKRAVPGLSVKELSLDEFADGVWYRQPESFKATINPYMIHNNFVIGNRVKIDRAKRFHHWFLRENMTCNMGSVHRVVKNE